MTGMVGNKITKLQKKPAPEETIKPRRLCVCASLRPALFLCKILGMFPIVTTHDKDGNCVFASSRRWFVYSIVWMILSLARALGATDLFDFLEIGRRKSLHPIIAALNDIVYALYIVALTAMNLYRCPKFVETLNRSTMIIKESLYCQSARRAVLSVQWGVIFVFVAVCFIKFAAIMYVHYSESYETGFFSFKIYSNAIVQTEVFTVYVIFIAISSVLMGMFGCFEKYAIDCLNFTPIHPIQQPDAEEMHNVAEFMGIIDYKLCDEIHPALEKVRKLQSPEMIEYLRCLHEEICVIMYEMNECMNPQFLAHVVVELTVLILNWYAAIMYLAYTFVNPMARTLHFLNIFFVIIHTLGLLVFLKQAQQLQNLARGLINLLLEYSTRVNTPDEHQQVRIFIEKMKGQRPLSANGVFDIDLGIAGPVCANILTYVLVALQFDIPKT